MVNNFIFIVLSFVAVVTYVTISDIGGNVPHGPTGLPFVGYYFFLSSKPYIDLQNLAKIYGPIFSVQLGSQHCIILDDYQSTKDAFAQDAFLGRPPENPFDLRKATLETGAFNGLPWKEQRRFSLQMLKDLGFGKSHLEDMIKEEIRDLLDHLGQSNGQPIVVKPVLSPSMSNNIASLVFGKRLKYDDPVRMMLDRTLSESAAAAGQVTWQLFFPRLARVAKFLRLGNEGKIAQVLKESRDHTLKEIEEHEKTLDPNNIRDYIDGYLVEIKKRNDPAFCKEVLQDMVGAFFGAGSETVRLTLDWLVLTMAAHQDVQKKVQQEIDNVIGTERMPSWYDHSKMPYTEATIMELMRWRTIVPINILRYTLWDTELNGFFIPKDSYVLANLWSIHHNPKYWGEDAEDFRPARFLSEDGKEVIKSEYFIPFSIEEVLQDMVGAFFGAGSETVRLTLEWLILTMAAHQDVQKKVQQEIDSVVGTERMPSWDDHSKLPYTEATIMELMRWRTIVPINILRYTLWDTELNGYHIPKSSFVLANLWSVQHNPKYWGEDVEVFRPERFLSEDGKEVIKPEYFIPFSIGKRSCPGESYAKTEVFLYFTSILQKFQISLPEGVKPDFDGQLGIGLAPKPHDICFKERL